MNSEYKTGYICLNEVARSELGALTQIEIYF